MDCLLDPAVRMKKHADELRRTACDFRTRVAKCIQWNFRTCVWNRNKDVFFVTNLSFKYLAKIKIKLTVNNLSFFCVIHIASFNL